MRESKPSHCPHLDFKCQLLGNINHLQHMLIKLTCSHSKPNALSSRLGREKYDAPNENGLNVHICKQRQFKTALSREPRRLRRLGTGVSDSHANRYGPRPHPQTAGSWVSVRLVRVGRSPRMWRAVRGGLWTEVWPWEPPDSAKDKLGNSCPPILTLPRTRSGC